VTFQLDSIKLYSIVFSVTQEFPNNQNFISALVLFHSISVFLFTDKTIRLGKYIYTTVYT